MKKVLDFPYPFSGFTGLDFVNCFASLYMFLEDIKCREDYDCPAREGKGCTGCGSCNDSPSKRQEDIFFFFGTMSGETSLRQDYDKGNTEIYGEIVGSDSQVRFVTGLTGWEYEKQADNILEGVIKSIDAGIPVLAKLKDGKNGLFRVINGYDGDALVIPDPKGAQRAPDRAPVADEVESLYIIIGKKAPKYTLRDGLSRIRYVMEHNRDTGYWDTYISKFKYWDEKLSEADFEELKRRFKRVCDTAWHTFDCHNFAETFRHRIWEGMKDTRYDEPFRVIDAAYDLTHTRGWQLIALNDCRDWSSRRYNELEWGMCECVRSCLESYKKNDEDVLAAVIRAMEV
ncbi:MAG: hypothetical protein AB9835_00975 [Eubacteriales bacterium]